MRFGRLISNLMRYGRNPKSAILAVKSLLEYRIVKNSSLLDQKWISDNYSIPDAPECDPVLQYIVAAHTSNLTYFSPQFSDGDYRAVHKLTLATLPIVHYELFGKRKGLVLSTLEMEKNHGQKMGWFQHDKFSFAAHLDSFTHTIEHIKKRINNGQRVRVAFLVFSASMFPTRPLLDKILNDDHFIAKIVVIPDLRWSNIDPHIAMKKCRDELSRDYPDGIFIPVDADGNGVWPDVLRDFDIVSYPSPYDLSDYHYNPRWTIGRTILPIQANYTLSAQNYGIKLFSMFNQAIFWKIFFENELSLEQFKDVMIAHGANCPVTGCMKMDSLSQKMVKVSSRKCIIIAPHHSIAGGFNDLLSTSNFLRYATYFKDLPRRYPQIDFVFRPHPFLIQALKKDTVWGPEKTDAYMMELKAYPNMRISTEGDYMDLFARSDGIIQDCCSFLIEYFYTGKPQCYMLKSEEETQRTFLPLGRRCLDECYQALGPADIDRFLTDVILSGNDVKRDSRNALQSRLTTHYPNATDAAFCLIKTELGLT